MMRDSAGLDACDHIRCDAVSGRSKALRRDDLERDHALQDDVVILAPQGVEHCLHKLRRSLLQRMAERGGDHALGES